MEFKSLALPENLKKALGEAGYINAMPVQEKVIELGLDGRDLYVQSQTGTGKTAAFLIVIFHRLLTDPSLAGRKALIMVPTRELAVQVEEEARLLGRYLPFKTGSFYGGVGYGEQQKLLRNQAQILVGTPGRVLDLNSSGEMNLMDIAFLVLDEADRMFDMGFYPDLRKLIKVVSPAERRQTMLFSATLNVYVKNLALEYTDSPLEIEIEPERITVDEIEQLLYHVPSNKKFELLLGIFHREKPASAIIFCNTKRYTEVVSNRLRANGIKCEFISGDLPQKKRLALINDFKAGKYRYLAATDVAARGIDIEGLSLVVNYDLPAETENYVHRIGRTARAGADGKAISFASEQDVYELSDIEKYIGKKIPSEIAHEELYCSEKRHDARTERNHDRKHDVRRQKDAPASGLSNMSFEERIEYYKQKYEKPVRQSGGRQKKSEKTPDVRALRRNDCLERDTPAGGVRQESVSQAANGVEGEKKRKRRRGRRRAGTSQKQLQDSICAKPDQYINKPAGSTKYADKSRGGDARHSGDTRDAGRKAKKGGAKKGLFSRIAAFFGGK
jgi:ATP-dependent RNA helicase RhlB